MRALVPRVAKSRPRVTTANLDWLAAKCRQLAASVWSKFLSCSSIAPDLSSAIRFDSIRIPCDSTLGCECCKLHWQTVRFARIRLQIADWMLCVDAIGSCSAGRFRHESARARANEPPAGNLKCTRWPVWRKQLAAREALGSNIAALARRRPVAVDSRTTSCSRVATQVGEQFVWRHWTVWGPVCWHATRGGGASSRAANCPASPG